MVGKGLPIGVRRYCKLFGHLQIDSTSCNLLHSNFVQGRTTSFKKKKKKNRAKKELALMQKPFKLARDPNARLLTFISIRGSRGQIPWQCPGPKPQSKLDGNPCASQMFAPNLVGASLPASLNRHLGSGYWNILQDYWQLICGATPKPQQTQEKVGKPRVYCFCCERYSSCLHFLLIPLMPK